MDETSYDGKSEMIFKMENFKIIYETDQKQNRGQLPILQREYLNRPVMWIREPAPDGVVIRLDVAESLLRRGLHKMGMTRMVTGCSIQ